MVATVRIPVFLSRMRKRTPSKVKQLSTIPELAAHYLGLSFPSNRPCKDSSASSFVGRRSQEASLPRGEKGVCITEQVSTVGSWGLSMLENSGS